MLTKEMLDEMARIIVRRGIKEYPDGAEFKHNEAPGLPRAPFKLHLCTSTMREEGRMSEDDLRKIVQAMYGYIKHHRLDIRALGCVPSVGLRYAELLQEYAREHEGRFWHIVLAEKVAHADGSRTIGPIIPNEEYPKGPLWLIDDVLSWGQSKAEAYKSYKAAGYQVAGSLVAVDYDVGARALCEKLGFRSHHLLDISRILEMAQAEQRLDMNAISQALKYIAASRLHLAKEAA